MLDPPRYPGSRRCRLLNRRDRTPERVVILGVERRDVAVGQGHVEQSEQPRVLPQVERLAGRQTLRAMRFHISGELSIQKRADFSLFESCDCSASSHRLRRFALTSLKSPGTCGAAGCAAVRPELRSAAEHEGCDIARHPGNEREVEAGREAPFARSASPADSRVGKWRVRAVRQPEAPVWRPPLSVQFEARRLGQPVRESQPVLPRSPLPRWSIPA